MKKIVLLLAMACSFSVYGQEKIRIDADTAGDYLIRETRETVAELLKGAQHEACPYGSWDIYYLYDESEGHNIPVKFYYREYENGELRVRKIEYPSRMSKGYKTNNLQEAFWIEYIRHPREE